MKMYIKILMNLYLQVWFTHWKFNGRTHISLHQTLSDLYDELPDFIDEYTETRISVEDTTANSVLTDGVEFTGKALSISELVKIMKDLRVLIIDNKEPELNDWCGRLITRLNHYIFMLSYTPDELKVFDTKDSDKLVDEIRSVFATQKDFVAQFKDYKDGVQSQYDDFFKTNYDALDKLVTLIQSTNQELFDARTGLDKYDNAVKAAYNETVKYFDIFS